jgi:hypothetical protein
MAKKQKIDNVWMYKGETYNPSYEELEKLGYYGFVYLMEDTKENVYYVGEKSFHSFRTPKGKKNKKRQESNWRLYPSSNGVLSLRIKKHEGDHNERFKFHIVALCADKPIMKVEEVKWIMVSGAIATEKYLNDNVKINVLTTYKNYDDRVPVKLTIPEYFELVKE